MSDDFGRMGRGLSSGGVFVSFQEGVVVHVTILGGGGGIFMGIMRQVKGDRSSGWLEVGSGRAAGDGGGVGGILFGT